MSLAASVVMFSCTSEKKQEVKVDEKPLVRLETVKTQEVEQIQEFTATVEANVVNNIVPSMSLRINDILVEVGDHVRKGQVLAQMDKTNLLQSQTQLENIQLEYDRAFELYMTVHLNYIKSAEGVSKFRYILFSYPSVKNAYNETKPRLSQAKALPYHKNFVSL